LLGRVPPKRRVFYSTEHAWERLEINTKLRSENRMGRALGIPRRRWEDNIRTNRGEIGWEGVGCMRLAQDRDQWQAFVNTVMKLRAP